MLHSFVPSIIIAVPTVGAGMSLENSLARAGAQVRWIPALAEGPGAEPHGAAVILLDGDHLGARLPEIAQAWRQTDERPGLLAIGDGEEARAHAPLARITLLAGKASEATLLAAVREAYRLRFAGELSWPMLCGALELPITAPTVDAVAAAVVAARDAPIELARVALATMSQHYVTGTALVPELLEARVLAVPERAVAQACDGTRSLQTLVQLGALPPSRIARLVWTLACAGAVTLTPFVRDTDTPARRELHELRRHLERRKQRLAGSTFYDVLEVTPRAEPAEIEAAVHALAARYAPRALAAWDLAELADTVGPLWELVERARATLLDMPARGRYHDWLRSRGELRSAWAIEPATAAAAAEAFARGQAELGAGEPHRAIGELARACRLHAGQPEYEATLAWARFRVGDLAGNQRAELLRRERAFVEDLLLGARPWPRALLALALLCAADGDRASAQWHLQHALTFDPSLAAARALRHKLAAVG